MGETRQCYEFVPFPLFLSFVQVVLFWRTWGEGDVGMPPPSRRLCRMGVGGG